MERPVLLHNIVKLENEITELTCRLLQVNTEFRTHFINFLEIEDLDPKMIKADAFETQVILENRSIPDLAIVTDEVEILFEIKTYQHTELRSNQPQSYVDYLAKMCDKKIRAFFFLIPKNYIHRGLCSAYINTLSTKIGINEIYLRVIEWSQIIKLIESKDIHKTSDFFYEYYMLLKTMFDIKITNLTNKNLDLMFDKTIPETIEKIIEVLTSTKMQLINELFFCKNTVEKNYESYFNHYGINILDCNNENEILYFGTLNSLWKEIEEPIALQLLEESESSVKQFKNICTKEGIVYKFHRDGEFTFHFALIDRTIIEEGDPMKIVEFIAKFKSLLEVNQLV